jgi:hypothetical protein
VLGDGSIRLEVEVQATTVDRPVRRVAIPTPLGPRLVDRPVVRTLSLHTTIQVADGSTVLLGLDGSPIDTPLTDRTVPTTAVSVTPSLMRVESLSVGSVQMVHVQASLIRLLAKSVPRLR